MTAPDVISGISTGRMIYDAVLFRKINSNSTLVQAVVDLKAILSRENAFVSTSIYVKVSVPIVARFKLLIGKLFL